MAAGKLSGGNDTEKLRDLFARPYKDQAIWILNGFWESHQLSQKAEDVWKYVLKHVELDTAMGANGATLDEFNAHRFLESIGETLTVLAMREKLASFGVERVRNVPISHYLMWKYNLKAKEVANAPQGSNPKELAEAQRLFDNVLAAFREVERTKNLALEAERPFKEAQDELNRALAELKAQEDAYANRKADLTKKSETGGAVQKNKAKAELEIHLKEDPLPLRKAKITTEAAERKADKVRAPFRAAREVAEAAEDEARRRLDEAEAFLNEVKKKPGQAYGALWWLDRELQEQRKYLPSNKRK